MGRRAIIMDTEDVRDLASGADAIRSANARGFQMVALAADAAEDDAHETVRLHLAEAGARLDGIYERAWRTFERARDEMGIDLSRSYLIGHSEERLEDGRRAGTTNILLGRDAPDLERAVRWILDREAAS